MVDDLGIPGINDPVEVGRGGFAVVYRAEQPAFGRTVAVKVLAVHLDERALARFERECRAMGALSDHPGIVPIFDAGTTRDGRPYLLMPFLASGSLQDALDREGPLPWPDAVQAGVRLAGALTAAHALGIVHRDIKPANALRSRYGEVMLADFGIARVAGGPQTTEGIVTASVAHAAPEVLEGAEPSISSDVYALASTVHALISGRPPFQTSENMPLAALLHAIIAKPVPPLEGAPPELTAVLEAAMTKDPAQRTPDAETFGRALQGVQEARGLPVTRMIGIEAPPRTSGEVVTPETVVVTPITPAPIPPMPLEDASPADEPAPTEEPARAEEPAPTEEPARAEEPAPTDAATVIVAPEPAADSATRLHVGAPTQPPVDTPSAPAPRRSRTGLLVGGSLVVIAVIAIAVVLLTRPAAEPVPDGVQEYADDNSFTLAPAVRLQEGSQEVTLEEGRAQPLTVELAAGDPIRVRTEIGAEEDDAILTLFNPSGDLLTESDDSGAGPLIHDALVDWIVDADGTYTVLAREFSNLAVTYTLHVGLPDVAGLEDFQEGELNDSYEVDVYGFSDAGGDVVLTVQSDIDVQLAVLKPDGEFFTDDNSDGTADLFFTADQDGHYYVAVQGIDGDTGSYALTVEGL